MIIVVEGPSAAGKTTWVAGHREHAAVIEEYAGRANAGDPASLADPIEAASYWALVNANRWASAIDAERRGEIVLCDSDPFKLSFTWSLWRAGLAAASEWRAARDASRRMFAARRLGIADLFLVSIPDQDTLTRHKDADKTRKRRNFGVNSQLGEPLREWYHAVSQLDATRVHWSFPATGLHDLVRQGPRKPRTGPEIFDHLIDLLPNR